MASILEPYLTEIVSRYNSGDSTLKIGKDFSVDPRAINQFLRKNGVSIRSSSLATRRYNINENYFDVIGKEQAYILGLLFADGCNYINLERGMFRVSIDLQLVILVHCDSSATAARQSDRSEDVQ